MLGIVFGVFSVIAMLAIGEGASQQAQKQVLKLGATNIIVLGVKPPQDVSGSGGEGQRILIYGLLRSDYTLLSQTIPTVTKATPIRELLQDCTFQRQKMTIRLVGCTAEYQTLNHLNLSRGRFISDRDQDVKNNIAVISSEVATHLFGFQDPLYQIIKVGSIPYTVVGIAESRTASAAIGGSLSGQDFSKDVYIPIHTLWARLTDQIVTRASGSFSAEQVELNQITLHVKERDEVLPTSKVVEETLAMTHPAQKDYEVIVPLELLKQADQIRQIFNIVLGSIAAISLIVGGIGIMNIMLATVTERTREIGIRRALGATQSDITYQFLMETIVMAGTGGVIGIILGLLTPYAFKGIQKIVNQFVLTSAETDVSEIGQLFSGLQPEVALWSLPVAFGISVAIGVGFGLYPARAAAKLDPIEALRHG